MAELKIEEFNPELCDDKASSWSKWHEHFDRAIKLSQLKPELKIDALKYYGGEILLDITKDV